MNYIVAATTPIDRSTVTSEFSYRNTQTHRSSKNVIPMLRSTQRIVSVPIKPKEVISAETENKIKKLMDQFESVKPMYQRRNLTINSQRSINVKSKSLADLRKSVPRRSLAMFNETGNCKFKFLAMSMIKFKLNFIVKRGPVLMDPTQGKIFKRSNSSNSVDGLKLRKRKKSNGCGCAIF
jgi:hypothetical protein